MENKQNNTHKNRKNKHSNHNISECKNQVINKGIETIKNSKTLQEGVTLLKDTALGIGSLLVTAVSEVTYAIKTIANKK
jgi:hypothetical protein